MCGYVCLCCSVRLTFVLLLLSFFFFKQKTAYEMRISDWSSDVCSSDLALNTQQFFARNGFLSSDGQRSGTSWRALKSVYLRKRGELKRNHLDRKSVV